MYRPELLRKARRSGGFTLREIGNAVEIDPSAIAAYELRRANPSVGALNRWEAALERLLTKRSDEIGAALLALTGPTGTREQNASDTA